MSSNVGGKLSTMLVALVERLFAMRFSVYYIGFIICVSRDCAEIGAGTLSSAKAVAIRAAIYYSLSAYTKIINDLYSYIRRRWCSENMKLVFVISTLYIA